MKTPSLDARIRDLPQFFQSYVGMLEEAAATPTRFDEVHDQWVRSQSADGDSRPGELNRQFLALPNTQKLDVIEAAVRATSYKAGQWDLNLSQFAGQLEAVRDLNTFFMRPRTKSVHGVGADGVVNFANKKGPVPAELDAARAYMRVAPGDNGRAAGVSFLWAGAENALGVSRPMMKLGAYSTDDPVSTRALGMSTAPWFDNLDFELAPALKGIELDADHTWTQKLSELPEGTLLGTVQPRGEWRRGEPEWSMEVRTGETPLKGSLF
ncbi:MAG: hypothetical protein AAFY60_20660, partial [Myxococcota bacterium]